MSRFPMNRYDEQRLIQDVHYLHSLLHQDPPRPHPHPHPHLPIPTHPTPYQTPIPTPVSLQPSSSTQFKKRKKNPKRVKEAIKAVSEYLKNSIDDSEEKGQKDYEFFVKLFEEEGGLREYYEKNRESSWEFSCLVCCGVGKKGLRKKFKHCVALVRHSITKANMNTRQAHRAYGQVICNILGLDITRLRSIVLTAGYNKPSESSHKPVEPQVLGSGLQTSSLANSNDGSNKTLQGNEDDGGKDSLSNTTDTVNIGSDESSQLKQSFSNENQQENGGGSTALEHNFPIEASVSDGKPETAKENTEGASNCPRQSRSAWRKAAKRRYRAINKEKKTVAESEGLGNEGDGGKNGLSNTTDTLNIGSNELSQQKEPFGNENQQENGGGSTTLEHNSTSEANASRSLEDVSNYNLETAKENAEGASNCPEPMQEDVTVANEENNCQKDDVSKETTIVSDMS